MSLHRRRLRQLRSFAARRPRCVMYVNSSHYAIRSTSFAVRWRVAGGQFDDHVHTPAAAASASIYWRDDQLQLRQPSPIFILAHPLPSRSLAATSVHGQNRLESIRIAEWNKQLSMIQCNRQFFCLSANI